MSAEPHQRGDGGNRESRCSTTTRPTSPPPRPCLRPTRRARRGRGRPSDHVARHQPAPLTHLIERAVLSLAIETEELTDPAIAAALLAARRGASPSRWLPGPPDAGAAFAKLAAAGARCAPWPPRDPREVVVADARTLYVGSANFTPTSLDRNRELGLRLDDADSRGASPRPWRTTPPAASHRRRYIALHGRGRPHEQQRRRRWSGFSGGAPR